jgi:hypothetical protein
LKIFLAGERDLKKYAYMGWIKNRLMSYYYHNENDQPSKDITNWMKLIKKNNRIKTLIHTRGNYERTMSNVRGNKNPRRRGEGK